MTLHQHYKWMIAYYLKAARKPLNADWALFFADYYLGLLADLESD